jgi:hypothetical protein
MNKRRYVIGATGTALILALVAVRLPQRRHETKPADDPAGTLEAPVAAQVAPMVRQLNANQRSAVEAVQTHSHHERLSPLMPPKPFDRAAWERDPQAYLDVVEPGRVFHTATSPGPDTPHLKAAETSHVSFTQPGAKVPLMVMGAPGSPVTFTAFGAGEFTENGMNSISVKADARGYARVEFKVPEHARQMLPVLVGSPMSVGNQRFLIDPRPRLAAN